MLTDIFTPSTMTDTQYQSLEVIQECNLALSEGVLDPDIVITSKGNSDSLLINLIESAKEALTYLFNRVVAYFNNYILNSANLVLKYEDLIYERFDKLGEAIRYETYTYPKLFDKSYPVKIPATSDLEPPLLSLIQEAFEYDMSSGDILNRTTIMLEEFSTTVLGAPVTPGNVKDSADAIALDMIRGGDIVSYLSKADIHRFIKEIADYPKMKAVLSNTRNSIKSEYTSLKKFIMNTIKKTNTSSGLVKDILGPKRYSSGANTYLQYNEINQHVTDLLNAYIIVYQEAYNTKLKTLYEKIQINNNVIQEIFRRAGLFASVNNKGAGNKVVKK